MPNKKPLRTQDQFDDLCHAFVLLRDAQECRRFLLDICTPAEIKSLSERWRVARILDAGDTSYREIHEETGVSVTTIGRVARFLKQEPHQGYTAVLRRWKQRMTS